jgi:hypothetical protein
LPRGYIEGDLLNIQDFQECFGNSFSDHSPFFPSRLFNYYEEVEEKSTLRLSGLKAGAFPQPGLRPRAQC